MTRQLELKNNRVTVLSQTMRYIYAISNVQFTTSKDIALLLETMNHYFKLKYHNDIKLVILFVNIY